MHLKTLTIRGFKSFASATTFAFEPGVTAVVGPNGSGKSNVVDALAWVMGEQGAKTLRGGSMEDVIFAGTAEREPLGRASVALTIDNSDGVLPIEYSEVTISRTMFRTGGSEYTINGQRCRLLDIQELLSDSGLGREMHVIVGQGQLDQVLQATPEQRRGFIEEAAGVLKHRRRRERTVRKLESMQGNLDRLEDLISEISRQLAPLGRQAKVARRAQRIQFDVRDSLSRLIADDLVQAATALNASQQGEEDDQQLSADLKETLAGQDSKLKHIELVIKQRRTHRDALVSAQHRLEQVQEKLRSVASVAEERASSLFAAAQETPNTGRDPEQIQQQADALQQQVEQAENEVTQATQALAVCTEEREKVEEKLKIEEHRLTEHLRAIADRKAGLATLQGKRDALQGRLESAEDRRRKAEENLDAAKLTKEKSTSEFAELEQKIVGIETGEETLDSAYENAENEAEKLRGEYEALAEKQRELSSLIKESEARLSGLESARMPRDGAAALVEEFRDTMQGRLADQLKVEPQWQVAVTALMGSAEKAMLTANQESASAVMDWLAQEERGRAHLIFPQPEATDSSDHADSDHPAFQGSETDLPEDHTWAWTVIQVPAQYRTQLNRLFLGVVFTQSEPDAELLERADVSTIVDSRGTILRQGEHIGGTALSHSEVAIATEIHELQGLLAEHQQELISVDQQLEKSREHIAIAEHRVTDSLNALHANDAELNAVTEQLGNLGTQISRAEERILASESEISESVATYTEVQERLKELDQRLAAAKNESIVEEPTTELRDQLAEEATQARGAEVDARLGLRASESQHKQLQDRVASLRRSAHTERERLEQAKRVSQKRQLQGENAAKIQAQAQEEIEKLDDDLSYAQQSHRSAVAALEDLESQGKSLGEERQGTARQLEQVTSRLHQAELTRTELRLTLERSEQRGQEELSLTPEYLIENYGPDQLIYEPDHTGTPNDEFVKAEPGTDPESGIETEAGSASNSELIETEPAGKPFDRDEQNARLERARKDLKALGKVNPLALEEHAALEERHTYLQQQLTDLRKSKEDLLDIIREVDATVEQVFTRAWEDTRVQFERVFSRLFPGGEGRLELTQPEDMLNTGIEVHARPPGKRIRRLSLLSGGERSLTAVALLVAIFKARPSPFYVMDEVEAALDDTNLSRLLVIFEELRESSQLIVITHQKRTMEIADALYGVSMRQDGSTRVVSQRLTRESTSS